MCYGDCEWRWCWCTQDFYGASAGKSWLTVVNQSSHTEFLNAGPILNRIIAGLCGTRGRNSFQVLIPCNAPGSSPTLTPSFPFYCMESAWWQQPGTICLCL